ncbi:hypothetical protein [Methylomicrobium sp. Wu6]|uniref:hypothetical protein n=1 Tax=Methylomicrobium sp. Wu6 TaxID=3107928 RepID=UPI002DD66C3C|nr:hypothetical protein [Methylomicrobium sp. Wu6]MEC4746980.1 hypothetical protein [Methylomicrobium sp. Wu6]
MKKKPTFWEGVVVALLASLTGAIGFFALSFLFPEDMSIRLVISGLAFFYSLYLLFRSRERIGRITVMLLGYILSAAVWLFGSPLTLFLILNILSIWLIRSLYFYSRLFTSLADLGLCLFGIASAFWALHHTGSPFLTFWCFFLIQAVFSVFPAENKQPFADEADLSNSEVEFKRAYQAAEVAVRKLSTLH